MNYTYFIIDLCSLLLPLVFSFHARIKFYRSWPAFFPAVVVSAIFFVTWDSYFTSLGIWGFQPEYLSGIYIGNLPLEEILFFFCIPYACVFTYHVIEKNLRQSLAARVEKRVTLPLLILLFSLAIVYYREAYSFFSFTLAALLLLMARFIIKANWLGKFYLVYAVLMLPFMIVNGILTGTGLQKPVVWYNESEIIGLRIVTIPVEDVFYGMAMILMNLMIYHYLLQRDSLRHRDAQLL